MKKIILSFIYLIGFSSIFVQAEENKEKNELLPEVKLLVTPKPLDPKLLENNLFIALLGAQYPHDDYYEVAQQALFESYENILQALSSNEFLSEGVEQIITKAYKKIMQDDNLKWQGNWQEQKLQLPCNRYLSQNCINQTIQNKELIKQYIQENQPLINRYHGIFTKYHSIKWINLPGEAMEMTPFPPIQDLMHVAELEFAEGIIKISEGNIDAGMDQLIMWQNNINQVVAEEGTSGLITLMIAVTLQQVLDQYINALLDSEYASRIFHRLPELSDLQLIYSNSVRSQAFISLDFETVESAFVLYDMLLNEEAELAAKLPAEMVLTKTEELNALAHLDFYNSDYMISIIDSEKLQQLLINQLGKSALADSPTTLDPQYSQDDYLSYFTSAYPLSAELNHYYAQFQKYIQLRRSNPYGTEINHFVVTMCDGLLHGTVAMSCEYRHSFLQYLKRVDIQRNYHNMVYLKIQILLQAINEKDILKFLGSQGDLAIDPITKETFRWNHATKIVSLPLIETQYLPAPIRNSVKDDANIKELQVKINI